MEVVQNEEHPYVYKLEFLKAKGKEIDFNYKKLSEMVSTVSMIYDSDFHISKIRAKYKDLKFVGTDPYMDYASVVPHFVTAAKPMSYDTHVTKEKTADGWDQTFDRGKKTANDGDQTANGREQTGWDHAADGGDQTTNGGGKTADSREKTDDGGDQTADGEEKTDDGGEKTADGEEKTADGEEKTADGEEKTADGEKIRADNEEIRADDEETSLYSSYSILKQLDGSLHLIDDTKMLIYKLIPDNTRFHSQLKLYDRSGTMHSTLKGKIVTLRNTWKATDPSGNRFKVHNKYRILSDSDLIVKVSKESEKSIFDYKIRGSKTDKSFFVYKGSSAKVVSKVVSDPSDMNKYMVKIDPKEDCDILREIVLSVTAVIDAVERAGKMGKKAIKVIAFFAFNSLLNVLTNCFA